MEIRFLKVVTVRAAEGAMVVKVWVRMGWQDLRLSWDPAAYGGLTEVFFAGNEAQEFFSSEVWVPDIQPYNGIQGTTMSLEPSPVRVSNDGSVFWSRPGVLDVMCKFSGLAAFPFDNLLCAIELGGYSYSGGYQGIILKGGKGIEHSLQEVTTGTSYQEFDIVNITSTVNRYTYPDYPSEPWDVAVYYVMLRRASAFYGLTIIFPGVLVTCLSFAVFFTKTESADPLGFGIGVIVVVLLGNLVLIGMLPVCGELLWIDMFMLLNAMFCCISLFESTLCAMLETHEESHLLPAWIVEVGHTAWQAMRRLWRWCRARCRTPWPAGGADLYTATAATFPEAARLKRGSSAASVVPEAMLTSLERQQRKEALISAALDGGFSESVAGVLYRQMSLGEQDQSPAGEEDPTELNDAEKLIYFERLFFRIDEDFSLTIDREECELLFSFVLLHLSVADRSEIFRTYNFMHDGALNRFEFVTMCKDWLWNVPKRQLDVAIENMEASRAGLKTRNIAYWSEKAQTIDVWARVVVPFCYLLCMLWLLHTDFKDDYLTIEGMTLPPEIAYLQNGPPKTYVYGEAHAMRSNFLDVSFSDRGVVLMTFFAIASVLSTIAWLWVKRLGELRAKRKREAISAKAFRNLRKAEGEATYGLSSWTDKDGRTVYPEYDAKGVGALARLKMPSFNVNLVDLGTDGRDGDSLILHTLRFTAEHHTDPVAVVGPQTLVDAFRAVGMSTSALRLHLSPFSALNLPLAARKEAQIPLAAVRFAFVHPIGKVASVSPGLLEQLRESTLGSAASDILLNGGFAYVDRSGTLLSLLAIDYHVALDASKPLMSGAFNFVGPFAMTRTATEALVSAKRFHVGAIPDEQEAQRAQKAMRIAWVRQGEFGLHAPFGAFAFQPGPGGSGSSAVYFTLVPINVPQIVVSVEVGASSPVLRMIMPSRSRVAEVKRAVEVQLSVGVPEITLSLEGGEQLRDEWPLEDYISRHGSKAKESGELKLFYSPTNKSVQKAESFGQSWEAEDEEDEEK